MTSDRPTRSPALALTATTLVVLFATALQTQAIRGPILVRVATAQAIASRVDGWPMMVVLPATRGERIGTTGFNPTVDAPVFRLMVSTRPCLGSVEMIDLRRLDLPPPARLS